MSLTSNNNQKGKGGNKNQKNNFQASKFIGKPAKGAGFSKSQLKQAAHVGAN